MFILYISVVIMYRILLSIVRIFFNKIMTIYYLRVTGFPDFFGCFLSFFF